MGKNKDKKKKVVESESTSDSGPDDVSPPAKKAKPNTSSSKTDEEPSWLLDRNRFVKVHEFKGNVYVDIREFYESDGELKPSRKGISLSPKQWQKLKSVISEVDEALKAKC